MRLFALGLGVAACVTCATAQAACLKASEAYQVAEGRLTPVRITITVRVSGEPFGEHTAHHHAPIVMRVSRVEVVPRK
jgi:hypothetical protein